MSDFDYPSPCCCHSPGCQNGRHPAKRATVLGGFGESRSSKRREVGARRAVGSVWSGFLLADSERCPIVSGLIWIQEPTQAKHDQAVSIGSFSIGSHSSFLEDARSADS